MDLDSLTIKEVKHIQSLLKGGEKQETPYQVGKNYFVKLVTHYLTGKLVRVTPKELVMVDVAWIADTGRYMQFLKDGTLNEVEPYPDGQEVIIGRGALIDATEWKHALPRAQK